MSALVQTVRRRCTKQRSGHTTSFDGTTSTTINLDEEPSDFVRRGHVSDDDCKRRRKQHRKQQKREKRQSRRGTSPCQLKEEPRLASPDGPAPSLATDMTTTTTTTTTTITITTDERHREESDEQDEQDTPRSENEVGSWISSSYPWQSESEELRTSMSTTTSTTTSGDFTSSAELTEPSWNGSTVTTTAKSRVSRATTRTAPSSPLDFLSGVHIPASVSNIGEAKRVNVRRVHLLYNPWSGNKKGEKKMRKARRMLERLGKEVTVTRLTHKGHAEELCATMPLEGIDVLCSVGGDGTFHECVNGLMRRTISRQAAENLSDASESEDVESGHNGPAAERIPPLAFIAAGTGNSFVHELGCVRTRDAVRHICRGIEIGLDLNRLTYEGQECYSFNSIHWGIGSRVVDTAERFRWMGNSVRYVMASLVELVKGNNGRVRMVITDENDKEIVLDESYALGIANTIITAGKGMKMAPTAKIDDGLVDLLLFTSTAPKDLLAVLRRFYNGTHIDLPHVHHFKAKKFTVLLYTPNNAGSGESGEETDHQTPRGSVVVERMDDEELEESVVVGDEEEVTRCSASSDGVARDRWFDDEAVEVLRERVDIDGELKGFTPFTCEVLPRAIQVIL